MARFARFLGFPHYHQGDNDGLCVFYSLSMLLSSMFPAYRLEAFNERPEFGSKHPLAVALREEHKTKTAYYSALGEWAATGMGLTTATKLLNKLVLRDYPEYSRNGDFFLRRRLVLKSSKGARKDILRASEFIKNLDAGLPAVLAGSTKATQSELQEHAVLAIGYDTRNANRSLSACQIGYMDPGAPTSNLRYETLDNLASKENGWGEVVFPRFWPEKQAPRPDRIEMDEEDDCYISRWRSGQYRRWPAKR